MSVRRVVGIETEYGVSAPGHPEADPVTLSSQVVASYAAPLSAPGSRAGRSSRVRWDYEDEAPLRDARGFEMPRSAAHASQLTDGPVPRRAPRATAQLWALAGRAAGDRRAATTR